MGQDPLELHPGQLLEQAGGHHDGGMGGAAAGGEAVGGVVVDQIELGLGEPGRDAEPFHQVVIAGLVVGRDGPGMAEAEDDPVGVEVGHGGED